MNEVEELEFAVREYAVSTEHLLEVMAKTGEESIPATVKGALMLLAKAINTEWGD